MRDPRPRSGGLLVELGGWFDHLAAAELHAVSRRQALFVAPRLAIVEGIAVGDLVRLGCGRLVHENLGASSRVGQLPLAVSDRLRGSYGVRFHDPQQRLTDADRRMLLSAVWRAHRAPRVELDDPDHDLHVYVTADWLWFGERLARCGPSLVHQPRRPFTSSYEMPVRKARVLVNLSGARPTSGFLDPFCGTGSLVIEAARIGCRALGSDMETRAINGAVANARFDGVEAEFFAADARALPTAPRGAVDSVAADLPYGRSAGRHGARGQNLYVQFLQSLGGVIVESGHAALMALSDDFPTTSVEGWRLEWSCDEYARTVTRSVAIWRRTPPPTE